MVGAQLRHVATRVLCHATTPANQVTKSNVILIIIIIIVSFGNQRRNFTSMVKKRLEPTDIQEIEDSVALTPYFLILLVLPG